MGDISFKYLDVALFFAFISTTFFSVACFGGSMRTLVLQNASWMEMDAKSSSCEFDSKYGIQGMYEYVSASGSTTKETFAYSGLASVGGTGSTGFMALHDAGSNCILYADTTMGLIVLALFTAINTFFLLLIMRLSESIRRNPVNVKYICMFQSLLSALFAAGALGFYYENCATALESAQQTVFKEAIGPACGISEYNTTAGPGSVMAGLGLAFMALLPFVLFMQASDPAPLSQTEVSDSKA